MRKLLASFFLCYSGHWTFHSVNSLNSLRKKGEALHSLPPDSGAFKLAHQLLPNVTKKFLFLPCPSSEDSKLRYAWSGDSDFLASALAWAAPEGRFTPDDAKAPIVLFSCKLMFDDHTKGLHDAKLGRVTSTVEASTSLLVRRQR